MEHLDPLAEMSQVAIESEPVAVNVPAPVQQLDFKFHGQGGEYFRIWIVNLVLSILTLSIYSAWAKVRTMRYFYGNTELAGSRFDFHGSPMAILRGHLIMMVFVVAYVLLSETEPVAALVLMGVLMLASPWMVVRSLKFRLANSSYRNIRFSFDGGVGQAYIYFLLMPLLLIPSLGLAFPFVQQRLTHFLISHIRYGEARLATHVSVGNFYLVYGLALATVIGFAIGFAIALVVVVMVFAMLGGGLYALMGNMKQGGIPQEIVVLLIAGMVLAYIVVLSGYLAIGKVVTTMLQQKIWSQTQLDTHRFTSTMRLGSAIRLHLGNIGLMVITLGLAWAWVRVRTARYRIDNLGLEAQGGLAGIRAVAVPAGSAVGEEMAEMFDFDIAL